MHDNNNNSKENKMFPIPIGEGLREGQGEKEDVTP